MEKKVLAACIKSRDAYMLVRPLIEPDTISDVGAVLFELMDEYYGADPEAASVDVELLKDRVERRLPRKADYLTHVLDNLDQVSVANVEQDFIDMRRKSIQDALGTALLEDDRAKVTEWMTKYDSFTDHIQEVQEDDSIYVSENLDCLLEMVDPSNLITVLPKALNEKLGGGLPKPCHILLYARPETGKSATSINMAAGFINAGHKTLYVGNEDNPKVMLLRFICRLSGMSLAEVRSNPKEAEKRALDKGYDNLVFAGLSPGTIMDVRRLCEQYEPTCVIVDQIHNLNSNKDNKVERLALISKELRDISNEYNLIMVSVTQAGDSAHNKLILDMGDVDYSNTGIPGNVDAMIGIGTDPKADEGGYRFFSLAKNKPGGGDHAAIKVRIEPAYSRITSL